jgi:hypothetical protein
MTVLLLASTAREPVNRPREWDHWYRMRRRCQGSTGVPSRPRLAPRCEDAWHSLPLAAGVGVVGWGAGGGPTAASVIARSMSADRCCVTRRPVPAPRATGCAPQSFDQSNFRAAVPPERAASYFSCDGADIPQTGRSQRATFHADANVGTPPFPPQSAASPRERSILER